MYIQCTCTCTMSCTRTCWSYCTTHACTTTCNRDTYVTTFIFSYTSTCSYMYVCTLYNNYVHVYSHLLASFMSSTSCFCNRLAASSRFCHVPLYNNISVLKEYQHTIICTFCNDKQRAMQHNTTIPETTIFSKEKGDAQVEFNNNRDNSFSKEK